MGAVEIDYLPGCFYGIATHENMGRDEEPKQLGGLLSDFRE
jgi:hypothetical protein